MSGDAPLDAAATALGEIVGLPYSGQNAATQARLREQAARVVCAYRDADAADEPYEPLPHVVNPAAEVRP